ncbi:MAG: hypothetical protein ACE5IY_21420 [bacterium]
MVTLRLTSEVVEHEPPHLSQDEVNTKRFIHKAIPHGGLDAAPSQHLHHLRNR